MSYKVGDSVRYLGKTWRVFNVDLMHESVELCDMLNDPHVASRCSHAEVTWEKLANEGHTREALFQSMMDKMRERGVADDEAVRKVAESVADQADKMMHSFESISTKAGRTISNFQQWADAFGPLTSDTNVYIDGQLGQPPTPTESYDKLYGQSNSCYGWSVLYRKNAEQPDDSLIEYGGEYAVEICASIEACWDMVDFLIDAEEGEALAIRDDLKCVYYQDGGRWSRNHDEYDEVPAERVPLEDRQAAGSMSEWLSTDEAQELMKRWGLR